MQNIQDILTAAVEQHRRRNFADAERGYREALALAPENADAHHLLGVLLFETRRLEEALPALDHALRIDPQFADAHYNLGRALTELRRLDSAVASYGLAIRARPGFTHAHFNLGNVLSELGRSDEAIISFRRAIWCDPNYAKAYTNLGHLLAKRQHAEAVKCFEKAAALEPKSAPARVNLAKLLHEKGEVARAEIALSQAIALDPNYAAAWSELGMIRLEQSNAADALPMLQNADRLRPGDGETLNNVGIAHLALGQFDEAIASLRQAVELLPNLAAAHTNLGNALHEAGMFDAAKQSHARAIEIQPDFAEAHFNLGIAQLLTGDFERGWKEYAHRAPSPLEPKDRPRWDGSPLARKTILLYPEQGMGDTIQFIRFAPALKAQGARVVFGCPAPLIRLLGTCAGIDQILPDRAPLPPVDCYAPLLSLPGLLGVNPTTTPAEVPYIFPPSAMIEDWRARLAGVAGFRVGIAWQGNPKHKGDRQRSVPLEQFEPLAQMEGVRLVSLQQGFGVEQIAARAGRLQVHDPGDLPDFLETAALMRCLDLVVTVDSAIAHVAGALGVPAWVMLPRVPDWRWLLDREDTPWYPSVRLFRQERMGEWSPVFATIAECLRERLRGG